MNLEEALDKKFNIEEALDRKIKRESSLEKALGEFVPTVKPSVTPKLKPIPKIDLQSKTHPESFIGRQMKGMEASLGLSKEEFDILETEIISQENRDSFVESVEEVTALAGQPYDIAKGASAFIMAGIPTFLLGVGGAVSEMNKELPQLFAGYSNLLDMADAAERGFNKVAEYMQPGKEKVEEFLEFPRETFKGAFGEPLSELLLGKPVDPDLVGELAMVPMTVAETPFAMAAESEKVKTFAKAAKMLWLDKVFVTEDNIRGALKFAGFFAGLAALHKVYRGKPGVVKEPLERSVIKDVKEVAEKAEKIAETEMLVEKTLEGAVKDAQEKILKMEKQQLELEAKKIAEDLKKEVDVEGVVKKDLKKKGKKIEEAKSGLRTAEERQAKIDKDFKEEVEVAIEKKVEPPKPKSKIESILSRLVNLTKKKKLIAHGTDVKELAGILDNGLRPGSALDTTGDWVRESPVAIFFKSAEKGKYIEHNKYYTSAGKTKIDQVVVDLDHYEPRAVAKIKADIAEIQRKHPNVKIKIINDPGEYVPRYNVDDVIRISDELSKAYEEYGDPKIETLREDIIKLKEPYKVAEHMYKNIDPHVRDNIAYIEKEIKRLERDRDLKINRLERNLREATADVDILIDMEKKIEPEPITEIDRQTGVSIPKLEDEKSPFFQTKEKAEAMAKVYEGRKIVDVEVLTQKLINDVNRACHGDKSVDITKVRDELSEIATRADELNMAFDSPADFREWKATVEEAAIWARRSEPLRSIKKQREGVELYSGIDPTKILDVIKKIRRVIPEIISEYEEPSMLKYHPETAREVKAKIAKERRVAIKEPKTFEDFGPLDGKKIEFIHHIKHKYSKTLKQAKDIADAFYEGELDVEGVKAMLAKEVEGVRLYTGIPLDKAGKLILEGAKRAKEYMDDARRAKRIRPVRAAKIGYEAAIRELVDKSGNIKWEFIDKLGLKGYEIVQKLVLAKGANTIAANKLKQMQREIYGGLTRDEKHILDNLIMYERLLEIAKNKTIKDFNWPIHKKSGKQLTPSDAISYVETFPYLEGITSKRASVIRRRAKGYFEWMKRPLDDLLKAELISQKEYDDLVSRKYRRIKLIDIFDKKYESKRGKKPLTVYDSGVQELARGRKTDIYEPSSEIMALEVFNRSYGRISRQEANKALLDLSTSDPKNPFVRSKDGKGGIPSGWQRIFVFDKGERKALYISPEMSKEWLTSSSELPYKYGRFMQYVSGSAVLRTFATGIEWGFAMANIPRDVMHIYYAARVWEDGKWKSAYSPHLPIFLPQIGMDIARVLPDVIVRGKKTQNYFDYGGGMEFLVHQGLMLRKGKHLEPGLAKPLKLLSWFGETSELTTRVAIKEHIIRRRAKEQRLTVEEARGNKDIQREASFVARDYMDFGQGGGVTKAADNAIPYLNAAVQATRGLWRTAKDNPKEFAYKTAEVGLVTTLVYSAMREQCPETAKALQGSMALQNNLCIPVGDNFGFEDEKGQMRYWGFKVPLDPSQRFFKTFFEAAYDKTMGHEVDIDRITNNMFELSPVGVSNMSPTISGGIGYLYNKDLWRNEDVWKKTKPFTFPRTKEEFIPGRTPEFFKDIGELTGLSPERTKHVAGELFTSNSTWAYLMGKGYDKLFADVPKEKVEQHWAMTLSRMPITGRFIFVTNPYSKYAEKIEEEEEIYVLKRWVENRELDRLTEGYLFEKAFEKGDVIKYIKSFKDLDTRERLRKRFDFQFAIRKLPERSFWLRLRSLAPEIRASRYYDRLQSATPEEHERLMREKSIVTRAGGFFTENFWLELRKIRREKE